MNERSDGRLLRLGRGGDEEAFLSLYHRYSPAVFRFALHMSGSREQAEEVVQEVFLTLLGDAVQFDEQRGSMEALLIGITRNQIRRLRREAWRTKGLDLETMRAEPAEEKKEDEDVAALRKAVVALPESYRAVTVLCDLQQLSYAEAAARLGCSVGTVRSRLHRARNILEAKLRREATRRKEQCRATTVR